MHDETIIHFGKTPDAECPLEDLLELTQSLAECLESLEEIQAGDHRDILLSYAIHDLQSTQNWLARWFHENIETEEEESTG